MCTASTAKRARRKAKLDPRYKKMTARKRVFKGHTSGGKKKS